MRNRFSLLLTLMLLLLTTAPSLFAQATRTWQLSGGGDWTVASNWDTPPSTGDNVVFNNVNGTITNIPAAFFVNNFTKSGTGTVTLASDLEIRGNLVVSGGGFVGATGTTITFNGTGAQSIGGAGTTTFHNLVINNAGISTTDAFGYSRTNPTNIQGSITVNGNMEIRRGAVAFCTATGATFNHQIAGNLVLGSSTSEVTISFFSAISNTEFVINHATNSNVTLTVNGNFLVPAGQGGVTAAMTSPTAVGGSSVFTVKGNVNAVDTITFSMNGRVNAFMPPSNPAPSPITMTIGTAGGSGDFIMSNYGNDLFSKLFRHDYSYAQLAWWHNYKPCHF